MSTFDDVLGAARSLEAAERIRLAEALWDDVNPFDWPPPSKEWIAEAQRRSAEYDQGQAPASSWAEVQSRARRKAGLDG